MLGYQDLFLLPKHTNAKFKLKGLPTVLLGYDTHSKVYRCFDPVQQKILISKDVVCIEGIQGEFHSRLPSVDIFQHLLVEPIDAAKGELDAVAGPPSVDAVAQPPITVQPVAIAQPSVAGPNVVEEPTVGAPALALEDPEADSVRPFPLSPPRILPCRSGRVTCPNVKHTDYHMYSVEPGCGSALGMPRPILRRALHAGLGNQLNLVEAFDQDICTVETTDLVSDDIPLREALVHPGWKATIQKEYDSLIFNETWNLVELSPGKKALSSKWVLKAKPMLNTTRLCLKARLMARGIKQHLGINYGETFALVVKWTTLRTIIALAISLGWDLHHLDVITAFLNGTLDELIFMRQPPGYLVPGSKHLVCTLHHSIYGLKQSPRTWYLEFDSYLLSTGWSHSFVDPNFYFIRQGASLTVLMLFVDNLLVTSNNFAHIT